MLSMSIIHSAGFCWVRVACSALLLVCPSTGSEDSAAVRVIIEFPMSHIHQVLLLLYVVFGESKLV